MRFSGVVTGGNGWDRPPLRFRPFLWSAQNRWWSFVILGRRGTMHIYCDFVLLPSKLSFFNPPPRHHCVVCVCIRCAMVNCLKSFSIVRIVQTVHVCHVPVCTVPCRADCTRMDCTWDVSNPQCRSTIPIQDWHWNLHRMVQAHIQNFDGGGCMSGDGSRQR